MRVPFIILFLIACPVILLANSFAAKDIAYPADVPFDKEVLVKIMKEKRAAHFLLGRSKQQRNVEAWYFPGSSDKSALVIAGVHGSELSSVEVAKTLIGQLQQGWGNYYNVIVIPSLFPDNAVMAINNPMHIGSEANIGRYSMPYSVDPNRQMPSPGRAFDEQTGLDHLGRKIEIENQLLLQLIQSFRPQRIINIHAIRNTGYGGVYADPRTDDRGIALGYASDSSLAIAMAEYIDEGGGNVNGNHLNKKPTALYYKDPLPAPAGFFQKRNMTGSSLNANRGSGVSLGTWASTAVANEEDPSKSREAMRIITMEYPGCKRPVDYSSEAEQLLQQNQIELFASSVYRIFLGNYFYRE
ncbi:MAG: hypothetical protein WDN26_16910 [Chitinophagaceae bacterium]